MELKKTNAANLEKKSSIFFLIGLVCALGMTLIAFTAFRSPITPEKEIEIVEVNIDPDEEIVITDSPIEEIPPPPPPPDQAPPPPMQVDIINIEEVEDDVKEPDVKIKAIEPDEPAPVKPVTLVSSNTKVNKKVTTKKVVAAAEPEPEDEDEIISPRKVGSLPVHRKCRKMVGDKKKMKKCLSTALSKEIGSNLSDDIEVEQKVRVVVSFVVGKDGKLTDVKALTGPSHLKSEATRAVKRVRPFEKPAMNNGKPTRMSYKVPIMFTPVEN